MAMRYQPSFCVFNQLWTIAIRGAASACVGTLGISAMPNTLTPSFAAAASNFDRTSPSALMMKLPILNDLSPAVKASSAANIGTSRSA